MKRHLLPTFFLVYCIILFSLTLLNFSGSFGQIGYDVRLKPINFIEKMQAGELRTVSEYFLNVLLFIPLGFLLPLVFPKRMGKWGRGTLTILGVTLAIEFIQFFIGRTTDVNDVIANFVGGFGAYVVGKLILKVLY